MARTIAQNYQRDIARDNQRGARADWCDDHVYKATIRRFGDGCEVSVRNVQAQRLQVPAMPDVPIHLQVAKQRTEEEQAERDQENAQRAAKRAKQTARWLLKTMRADHMLTLTARECITDLKRFQRLYQEFTRLVRKRYPNWQYVAVHELQERGAIHLHIGIRGRGDVHWLRRCWLMALGHRVRFEDLPNGKRKLVAMLKDGRDWRDCSSDEVRGNIQLRGPSKRFGKAGIRWQTEKLAAYMCKYMAKRFDESTASTRRYWPSKNIQRPQVEKVWLRSVEFVQCVEEVHAMITGNMCCSRMAPIWASPDLNRMWFSGAGVRCPF